MPQRTPGPNPESEPSRAFYVPNLLMATMVQVAENGAAAEERAWSVANRDPLTELYNRRALEGTYTRLLSPKGDREANPKLPHAVHSLILMDLDGFKAVNDSKGHAAGDEVLKGVARVIQDVIRERDIAARLGGDEFAILLPRMPEALAAERAESIQAAIPQEVGQGITASIGIAEARPWNFGSEFEAVLKRADDAMYASKRAGKNRVTRASEMPRNDA